ncbi:TetR family transcriptional regulator [Sphingorhabdus arenilitoris]|uniref:TetR family transcriptional regulator n=1 Tax=Sphingorhabdus arenilitoris TaxID=1490041 RepID=A0ABV8RJQ7_9SPHN
MKKTEMQREASLEKMADHVLTAGLNAASLRPLAKAAGTSDRMLVYYFGDKAGLMTAILQRIAARTTAMMLAGGANAPLPLDACITRTISILGQAAFTPYLQLFLQIASLSAQGDPFYRQVGEQMGRVYFEWAKAQLVSENESARAREAAILMQRVEGMVFLRAIGLDDVNDLAAGTDKGNAHPA